MHGMDVPPDPSPPGNRWDFQCNANPGEACQIDVDVSDGKCEAVQKSVKVPQNKLIHWKLKNATGGGWKFGANGIDFTTPKPAGPPVNPDASKAFENGGGAGTAQYQWHVTSTAPAGGYPYTIKVIRPDGTSCVFDPGIWV
jgi:hypothetical protein